MHGGRTVAYKQRWEDNFQELVLSLHYWWDPETEEESAGNQVHEGSALPIELTHQFHFKSLSVKLLHTIRNQVQNIWLLNNFKVNTFTFNELK